MSGNSWILHGVGAETRRHVIDAAEQMGVSVADYLTSVLLTSDLPSSEPRASEKAPQNEALKQRLEDLEGRIGFSAGNLDAAVQALDRSVFGLADRLESSDVRLRETAEQIATIKLRVTQNDHDLSELAAEHEAAFVELDLQRRTYDQRLDLVEDVARAARQTGSGLYDAYEALKQKVAEDIERLSQDNTDDLAAGMKEVCAYADDAAARSEAALEALLGEFASFRENIEGRIVSSVAETRGRMQAAFADATARYTALAERVIEAKNTAARTAEQLHTRIAAVESTTKSAVKESTAELRQAHDALARSLAQKIAALDARFQDTAEGRHSLGDVVQRIETGTLAAIEKLAADVTAGDQTLAGTIETATREVSAKLDRDRIRFERDLADLRGAVARLGQAQPIAPGESGPIAPALAERLARLENAIETQKQERESHARQLDGVHARLSSFEAHAAQINAADALEELRRKLAALEQRHVDGVEALRVDFVQFVGANQRRIEAMKNAPPPIPAARGLGRDVASEFEVLRRSIEQRMQGVETRSVRAMEQVSDTVALIERKLSDEPAAKTG
jgi:hypothetical protein